jgi:hypothetical protein
MKLARSNSPTSSSSSAHASRSLLKDSSDHTALNDSTILDMDDYDEFGDTDGPQSWMAAAGKVFSAAWLDMQLSIR